MPKPLATTYTHILKKAAEGGWKFSFNVFRSVFSPSFFKIAKEIHVLASSSKWGELDQIRLSFRKLVSEIHDDVDAACSNHPTPATPYGGKSPTPT